MVQAGHQPKTTLYSTCPLGPTILFTASSLESRKDYVSWECETECLWMGLASCFLLHRNLHHFVFVSAVCSWNLQECLKEFFKAEVSLKPLHGPGWSQSDGLRVSVWISLSCLHFYVHTWSSSPVASLPNAIYRLSSQSQFLDFRDHETHNTWSSAPCTQSHLSLQTARAHTVAI